MRRHRVSQSLIEEINELGIRNAEFADRIYVETIDGRPYALEPVSLKNVYHCINAVCPHCSGRLVLRIGPRGPHICNHCGSALGEFELVEPNDG